MTERSFADFLAALERDAKVAAEDEEELLKALPSQPITGAPAIDDAPPAPVETPRPRPRFCRECGTALKPDARFCGHCGAPIR